MSIKKLDLACGNNKYDGFTGVDIVKEGTQADIIHDLNKYPWPFEDNSVDEIMCSHYIEHTENLIKFMEEIYRILKVNSNLHIAAPYYSSIRCWQDPTHVRAISEKTFSYFNRDWRIKFNLNHYPIKANFDFIHTLIINPDIQKEWDLKTEEKTQYMIKHYINIVDDIHVKLTKI